jgi:hypothetical protein
LLALCSNPQPGGISILVAFYDMHGLQWDYSFPRSPHGDITIYQVGLLRRKRWSVKSKSSGL